MKRLQSLILMIVVATNSTALAQEPQQCIEDPQRDFPCEHYIVKKSDPEVLARSALDTPMVCICVSDFTQRFEQQGEDDATETTNVWLEQWQLTHQDLLQLLRY